ncbi:MAG: hypothetical protein VKK62_04655 [Synechococcaceae cyanobacterium]|nr:hypothetical protein [Synechococcaceae cyanobacterium]
MAPDPLDALRLTLMQDVLPVGLAVADRVRRGGPAEVMAAFDGSSSDPLGRLREEGEPAASQLRENLDRLQPGLGNPVMKVEVRDVGVEPPGAASTAGAAPSAAAGPGGASGDLTELQATLDQIACRLRLLEQRLQSGAPGADTDPA